jgi:integrase
VSTLGFGVAQPRDAGRRELTRTPTLAAYAATWLEGVHDQVRPRTFEGYSKHLERHVIPRLGEKRLDQIDVDDVLSLIANLKQQGYTGWTIRTVLTPLSRVFSHAVRRGVISASPISKLDRTERPTVWRHEQRVLNSTEIGQLLDAAPPRYRTLLASAVLTGLRQSELLGLRWRDIDFTDEVIRVRSALDRHGQHVEPKTRNAKRDVILTPGLAGALQSLRDTSPFSGPMDYVFASRVGTPLHWRNVARRALKPALTKAGIEPIRWHDLRHTNASLLIAGGANIAFVSRQLGHGSPDITLRVYSHLFDGAEHAQRTRDVLETNFGKLFH